MLLCKTLETKHCSNDHDLKTTTWGARIALLTLITLLAAGLSFADGKKHKLSKDLDALKGGHDGATVDVIIQFKQTPTAAHHQRVQKKGGILKTKLDVIKGAHYSVPVQSLQDLADDPDIAYISPNRPISSTSTSTLDYTPESVNAQVAWQQWRLDGTGVGVAVIDSGVTAVGDLYWWNPTNQTYGSRVVYSQSFVPGTIDTSDQYGHGTHVAGIIGSEGWFSTGGSFTHTFKGIAPNTNIINLRVLDQNGAGTDSSVIAAIQAAISLKSTYNIRVINLSFGRQVYESYTVDPLCQAAEAAWNAGIVVVAAAGNQGRNDSVGTEGYGTIAAPGNDPYVITVGAMKTANTSTRNDDTIASYSSKGPTAYDFVVKPDIVAPGNQVVSTLAPNASLLGAPTDVYLSEYSASTSTSLNSGGNARNNRKNSTSSLTTNTISTSYMRLSGTSMATPVASGAAVLLLQENPNLTPDQVKARLMKTASKTFPASSTATDATTGITYTDYYDIFTIGAGYLDVAAALSSDDLADAPAVSPTVTYDPTTQSVYLVTGTSVVWGTDALWDTSVVWGTNVFVNGSSVVWGTSVCWGSSTSSGFSVVWGTGVPWGDATNQTTSTALNVMVRGED
ncbi:MAG TPA: S8 family peptidase [Candidatus Angelobacter sp.]|nr:S8 family peptidase [Candidatus Angelobacter sp.]